MINIIIRLETDTCWLCFKIHTALKIYSLRYVHYTLSALAENTANICLCINKHIFYLEPIFTKSIVNKNY